MDEASIRAKIKAADKTPPPPQELVERTALRAACIENGRIAESRLEELARQSAQPDGAVTALAARALLGRMAMVIPLPAGAGADALADRLEKSPEFLAQADKPVDKLLSDVRSGRLLKALTKAHVQYTTKEEQGSVLQSEKGGSIRRNLPNI